MYVCGMYVSMCISITCHKVWLLSTFSIGWSKGHRNLKILEESISNIEIQISSLMDTINYTVPCTVNGLAYVTVFEKSRRPRTQQQDTLFTFK